jgi:hypothetical protein
VTACLAAHRTTSVIDGSRPEFHRNNVTKSFLDQVLVEVQGEHLLGWHLTGAEVLRLYLGGAVGSVVYKIKDEFRLKETSI